MLKLTTSSDTTLIQERQHGRLHSSSAQQRFAVRRHARSSRRGSNAGPGDGASVLRRQLDFRVIATWDYADEQLAYVAPPTDDHFYVEILGGGNKKPIDVRPYTDLGDSLKYAGYHHFCLSVASVDDTVAKLRARGVTIVTEPFVLPAISRRLAFFADPFGNLIELAEVLP